MQSCGPSVGNTQTGLRSIIQAVNTTTIHFVNQRFKNFQIVLLGDLAINKGNLGIDEMFSVTVNL